LLKEEPSAQTPWQKTMLGLDFVGCIFVPLVFGVPGAAEASEVPNAEMEDMVNAAEAAAPDSRTSRRVTNAGVGLLMCASQIK
jgi:hypothetical protein